MQDIAGVAAIAGGACMDEADGPPGQPKLRMVAATATPTASSVITVSAPLATDLSARTSVISIRIAKNPAAASVSHIGNDGERQMSSSEEAQAQFIREVPTQNRVMRNEHKVALSMCA